MSKYCGNCGAETEDTDKVCGMCGYRLHSAKNGDVMSVQHDRTSEELYGMQMETNQNNDDASVRTKQIIVSLIALFNVVFVPIFDLWAGLFPSNPDKNFLSVITGDCSSDEWVFIFTVAIFVPTILMLMFSILKQKKLARTAGFIGTICMIAVLTHFVLQYDFSYLIDFDDGNLSIGLWIGFTLFIAMACIPTKKKSV